jgi:hypothetical protein
MQATLGKRVAECLHEMSLTHQRLEIAGAPFAGQYLMGHRSEQPE